MRERQSMIGPSALKIIHGEAFAKLCEVLNRVHHVRRIDWDLCVPVVVWACRTMSKTLTTQVLPKLKYEAGAIVPVEPTKTSPHIIAPIDTMVCAY